MALNFGYTSALDKTDAFGLVRSTFDLGIIFFDAAEAYGLMTWKAVATDAQALTLRSSDVCFRSRGSNQTGPEGAGGDQCPRRRCQPASGAS